ncbi:hypothetical protein K437DRAFT_273395 [Tilletiaria anomala UBC 951]|uniref:Uncharacterized protein n=1 Tax=Tilletiaria anomala (strain ATCC 24038 / CBS 436.72 / UBC 951) TaxID=1037660 RepID=A0A066W449_TILAU|nr:uncharacterized protein K437DRAFT_273395 [Tilletiaria anomala UBC 951]KDN48506.1 hypothetical protein K437DRAFT_273395 [Tilletiaria anomala UBC 951]
MTLACMCSDVFPPPAVAHGTAVDLFTLKRIIFYFPPVANSSSAYAASKLPSSCASPSSCTHVCPSSLTTSRCAPAPWSTSRASSRSTTRRSYQRQIRAIQRTCCPTTSSSLLPSQNERDAPLSFQLLKRAGTRIVPLVERTTCCTPATCATSTNSKRRVCPRAFSRGSAAYTSTPSWSKQA